MKAVKILLYILLTPMIIAGLAYLAYEPEDYCKKAEFTKKKYEELSSELGMNYSQYMNLGQMSQLRLLKENIDYTQMKVAYEMNIESEQMCIAYMGMSKFNRFKIDVYSGNYFED
ncbi:hypothetical protein OAV56_02690 [Flavobacteriaceae bacterium]|nr:hypothetical protein [Flavobacteriaceae bacterium]